MKLVCFLSLLIMSSICFAEITVHRSNETGNAGPVIDQKAEYKLTFVNVEKKQEGVEVTGKLYNEEGNIAEVTFSGEDAATGAAILGANLHSKFKLNDDEDTISLVGK